MPEIKDCDTCGSIVKHIPAGTSGPKSKNPGTPYNDFWVCSNDNCSSRQRSTQNTQTPPKTQPNAAVEMIYELQAIRGLLEQILEESVANNTFFRKEQDNKPSVESSKKEPWDDLQLPKSEEEMPPPTDNSEPY